MEPRARLALQVHYPRYCSGRLNRVTGRKLILKDEPHGHLPHPPRLDFRI